MRTYVALHLNYDKEAKTVSLQVGDTPTLEKRTLLTVATDLGDKAMEKALMAIIAPRVLRAVTEIIKDAHKESK